MGKYELSISPSYVPQWGVIEAIREIFQNAIDQQATQPDNEMFWNYDADTEILQIGNKSSVLCVSSLLLGQTTKANDAKTIGKFGEGYKVGTLVLLRENKQITFFNYGANEIWKPRFVNSRRYKTQVLTFFVDRQPVWASVPDHNLTIEIAGITEDEFHKIVQSNLCLQEVGDTLDTRFGRILVEPQYAGKIFVNGLYVCDHKKYAYGYDFKPEFIKIDRDRKLVSDFDLSWLASQMWNVVDGTNDRLLQLIKKRAADVEYLSSTSCYATYEKKRDLRDLAFDDFTAEYGEDAVPISTQEELEETPPDRKPVMVGTTLKHLITESTKYKAPEPPKPKPNPMQRLQTLFEQIRMRLSGDEVAQMELIIDELKEVTKDAFDEIL